MSGGVGVGGSGGEKPPVTSLVPALTHSQGHSQSHSSTVGAPWLWAVG